MNPSLPIDELLPEILRSLESHPNLILEASPGSGKTTRVPPALLKAAFRAPDQEILILEPRRLAAKYSAHRIADEMGCSVGDQVGYQFRFENVSGPKTRLKFVTEGMFMRLLMSQPKLSRVAAVVLDEFHERHIQSDVALSYLKWLQQTHRPDLRMILMSATLDAHPLARYLKEAPILRRQVALHPIQVSYLPAPASKHLDQLVRETTRRALRESSGDILVFLPGMAEIRRCAQSLGDLAEARVLILHGEISRNEQDQVLQSQGTRKIILSTNVAETSLTIPGVTAVIDSGLHRMASYSWWSGIPSLKTRPISRASATQRTGRAGRTGPGICYRLYTQGDFETRTHFEKPEIVRSDLSQTLLDLKTLGVAIPQFPWFESPPDASLQASEDLLYRLGATEKTGSLTELGRSMSRIPAHPRVSRMLLEAQAMGILELASWVGAALNNGKIEPGNALDEMTKLSKDESLKKSYRILTQSLPDFKNGSPPLQKSTQSKTTPQDLAALARCILMGFPDRVAQKRRLGFNVARVKSHEVELLISSGGSAILEETQSMTRDDFFVLLDLQEQQYQNQIKSSLRVRSWIPIEEDWLLDVKPQGIEEMEKCTWDADRKRVITTSQLTYGELVLSESAIQTGKHVDSLKLLIKNGLQIDPEKASLADWVSALTRVSEFQESREIESAFARAQLTHRYDQSESPEFWTQLMPQLEGKSSLSELAQMDWPTTILQTLLGDRAYSIRDILPAQIVLPSGRPTPIHYSLSQPPWIQSRLQDFFGMKTGPVLLNGTLPVLIHLLAPNQRPVQVTSDLESFWKNHYPELRPALSRRYPRHSWPENPGSAESIEKKLK